MRNDLITIHRSFKPISRVESDVFQIINNFRWFFAVVFFKNHVVEFRLTQILKKYLFELFFKGPW